MQPRNFGRMPAGRFGPPSPQRSFGLFGQPAMPRVQGMDRGGLLSRLFQRQVPVQAGGTTSAGLFSRAPHAGGGSFLQGLTNPGSIQSFLNNTQQVLRTAQQIGPMVQQYGPLVRNLPAMWKLYKGFKDIPEQNGEKEELTKDSSKKPLMKSKRPEQESSNQKMKALPKGESLPKLYI